MAHNEPQRKETPPGPSPNSTSVLFEYQCRSGKVIRLANRIESKLFLPELECSIGQWTQGAADGGLCGVADSRTDSGSETASACGRGRGFVVRIRRGLMRTHYFEIRTTLMTSELNIL